MPDKACPLRITSAAGTYLAGAFLFVQAEDGIRDRDVTGVQTCALPISNQDAKLSLTDKIELLNQWIDEDRKLPPRSEERRVGKECRSRGLP